VAAAAADDDDVQNITAATEAGDREAHPIARQIFIKM